MRAIAFIFARGGSKGLVGKNIRPLVGKPLIAWSIEHALAVPGIARVIVSTDSPAIAAVAREYGAEVPFMRPPHLAADDTPEWLAWRHALEFVRTEENRLPDAMVSVPATAPLRDPSDITRCLELFEQGDSDIVVTVSPAHRSPYFNMVKENADGTVGLAIPTLPSVTRRQDAPVVYDMSTVAYVARPDWVLTHNGVFDGRMRAVNVPAERAVDIDTLQDFHFAEFLLTSPRN
jgi:N-acylneuraminate cytidylyltransferase